jgi:patatin-like phospholipase/acyl hydrolase
MPVNLLIVGPFLLNHYCNPPDLVICTRTKQTLEEILGDKAQATLKDLSTDILVCGVELTSGTARLFRSTDDGCTTPLIDIGLATSAAPTYFPEHLIDNAIFVDGGLVANAPDMLAILQALRQSEPLSALRLLSIGTAGREGGKAYRKQQSPGVIFAGKSTFELTLDAQEDLSVRTAQELLGERYIRLDVFPSEDERQSIGLDKTGSVASKTLRLMADRTWKEALDSHEAALRDMLNRSSNSQ